MRFIVALLLVTPVLARDSDRRADPQSPYLPLVVKNPGERPEIQVGVLDSRSGRLIWDRTVRLNPSRIATLSAYGNSIQVGIETEDRQVLGIERERHRAASARARQASFSLIRADLPERLRR